MQRFRIPSLALAAALAALPACQSTDAGVQKQAAPPDPDAAMAYMAELAQPGEHHRMLDPLVGDFRAQTSMWMAPGEEPQSSTGKSSNRWIFGGRFLQSEYDGEWQGAPFEGLSLMGYDNAQQEFVGFWIDTFSTGMIPISHGKASADGKTITMHRDMYDPMMGQTVKVREVFKIESDDRHTYEMFSQPPGADEALAVRVIYTRI